MVGLVANVYLVSTDTDDDVVVVGLVANVYLVSTDTDDDVVVVGLVANLVLHLHQPMVEGLEAAAVRHIKHQQRPLGVLVKLVTNLYHKHTASLLEELEGISMLAITHWVSFNKIPYTSSFICDVL